MSTPKTPKVVTDVHKAGEGGQVPPTGKTVLPSGQHEDPETIDAPKSSDKVSFPTDPEQVEEVESKEE